MTGQVPGKTIGSPDAMSRSIWYVAVGDGSGEHISKQAGKYLSYAMCMWIRLDARVHLPDARIEMVYALTVLA